MSEFTVEPTCTQTEVESEEKESVVVTAELSYDAVVDVEHTYEVEAQINEWQVVNDMIYVVQEFGKLPDWLQTAIGEIVNDPNGLLIDNIEELKALFDQFEVGYNAKVTSIDNALESQNTLVTSLISKTDDNAAGIVNIEDTYATKDYARASATQIVGAYLGDPSLGGAWFENSVSAVADVAYSAARSASSLNATIKSQAQDLADIYGSIHDIKHQIDGEMTTWFIRKDDPGDGTYFDPIGPVLADGTPNPAGKPYFCWVPGNHCTETVYKDDDDTDTRRLHSGDTYVWYELDPYGKKHIISTWRFGVDPDTGDFAWFIFEDDLASAAYQEALNAHAAADGKINTFFQTWAPTLADAGLVAGDAWKMHGDIWYDSTITGYLDPNTGKDSPTQDATYTEPIHDGTMRRYNGLLPGGAHNAIWSANNWVEVSDQRINASVQRLDEATVDVNGTATAKGSLTVGATGGSGETAVSGYIATAESGNQGAESKFRIFADKFEIASSQESLPIFTIDSTLHKAKFTANVTFEGNPELDNRFQGYDTLFAQHTQEINDIITAGYIKAVDVNANVTSIDGGVITTGVVNAARLNVNQLSALSANLGVVNAGVMYNSGANSSNYTFMINLNSGEIHIR